MPLRINYLAKLLSLRQEELVLRPQKFILMAGISIFFLEFLNDVPWRNELSNGEIQTKLT
jgi:hypothetical protein